MANSRSARKSIRASERKRIRNRTVRSSVRTYVSKARQAVLGQGEELDMAATLKGAIKALDRAAEKGILHRNNADRRKSRLMSMATKIMHHTEATDQSAARAIAAGGRKGTAGKAKTAAAKKPATKAKATAARKPGVKATAAPKPGAKAATAHTSTTKKS